MLTEEIGTVAFYKHDGARCRPQWGGAHWFVGMRTLTHDHFLIEPTVVIANKFN